jgi:hypothetical protein
VKLGWGVYLFFGGGGDVRGSELDLEAVSA